MSKFRRVSCIFILLEVFILICCNIAISRAAENVNANSYKVDISRIVSRMKNGEELSDIDLKDYKAIVCVKPFDAKEKSRYEYAVEEIDGRQYRFEYSRSLNKSVLIALNVSMAIIIIVTASLLLYLDRKIISPFRRMNSITTELAKGNLAVPIRQESGRYFKDFLWGLDMLRETLEDDRHRELELLKERKTLILSLSHDIKTPLSAIELYTKAYKNNLYDSEEKRLAAIEGIEKNTDEIKKYVSEITKASREDFLSLEVKSSEVYLSKVMAELYSYYGDKCARLHIDYKMDEVSDCIVHGDEDRIVEVMQNIMENAIKYGNGSFIRISFAEEENCKLVTVTNSGCSLEKDEIHHLFDAFYRGRNSEKVSGSGLGLYICKELMHKMDGDIFADISGDMFSITVVLRKV